LIIQTIGRDAVAHQPALDVEPIGGHVQGYQVLRRAATAG
jgi:hypothetical protein